MHYTAKRGILCLIPKKQKDPDYIKNWHPLTLLNTDHKIDAKVLAARIKPVLQYLIGHQQTGYMEGRNISSNLRCMIDVIQYVESENIPALMITIDFEKCFDTISFNAIKGALHFFNFGERFIDYVMLLYTNFQTKVLQNGYLSKEIFPKKGIHQGCSVSSYLFLLVAETLAIQLINNDSIKGIPIPNIDNEEELLSQFADDTAICLLFHESLLREVVKTLHTFYENTGLKANFEKTTIYRLGKMKHTSNKINIGVDFKWADENITLLGIILDTDKVLNNFNGIIEKIESIVKTWKVCNLTLKGKVTMLNSLIGSLFIYKLQVLPAINSRMVQKINEIIQDFIWNGKKPKIRLETLQGNKNDGGLGLFNLAKKDCTLKLQWIKKWDSLPHTVKAMAFHLIEPKIKNTEFWYCNFNEQDIKHICKASGFWLDVITYWANFNFHEVNDIHTLLKQRLWLNSHI